MARAADSKSMSKAERPWLDFNELPFRITRPPIALVVLLLLTLLAAGIFITRLATGWGLVTNLNDNYGWGLWKGFNTLVGIALGASGFTTAFAVYVLGGEKYRPFARMAVLVGILGYMSSVFSLLIDLGHPERIILPIVYWNAESPLFEVAWCVMLYMTVMIFEFTPAIFERFGMKRAETVVHEMVIPLVIGGTVLSTLHQSSLGSLFLNVPDQLDKLWYTPLLPLFFFMSAVYVGPAVVIVVATMASKALSRKLESDLLATLAKALPFLLGIYLIAKFAELAGARELGLLFEGTRSSAIFLLEISVGVIIPMVLLAFKGIRENSSLRFVASLMVVLGLMLNRVDVSIVSWARPHDAASYWPHPLEFGFTIGLWAGLALVFYVVAKYLPLFPVQDAASKPE
jgi:Ni/Fe-hydrogenase subunit HybB-like protein